MNDLHSTSLGSRINCTNSSSSQIAKSPVHNSLRKNYQSSGGISGISGNLSGNFSGNSYQKSISTSPITVTTMSDGRVERRLETCSYQETEMVRLNRIKGRSFSEALILASTNPQYDKRLFIDLSVQYMKSTRSEHVVYINWFIVLTF